MIHILYVLNIVLIVQARGSIHGQEVRRGGGVEGKEEDKDNKKMVMHLDHCVGHWKYLRGCWAGYEGLLMAWLFGAKVKFR